MKTTLRALNDKVNIVEDIRQDAYDYKGYLATSEDKRNNLHAKLQEFAKKTTIDTEDHDQKHDENLKEIKNLRAKLRALEEAKRSQELELLQQADETKKRYAEELQAKDKAMYDQEQKHNQIVSDLKKEHQQLIAKLQQDCAT